MCQFQRVVQLILGNKTLTLKDLSDFSLDDDVATRCESAAYKVAINQKCA